MRMCYRVRLARQRTPYQRSASAPIVRAERRPLVSVSMYTINSGAYISIRDPRKTGDVDVSSRITHRVGSVVYSATRIPADERYTII